MTEFGNNLIVLGETKKKGSGVSAVIKLLEDVLAFKDNIEAAAEAQINPKNKEALQGFGKSVQDMYLSLLDMAKEGIQTINETEPEVRKEEGGQQVDQTDKALSKPSVSAPVPPTM